MLGSWSFWRRQASGERESMNAVSGWSPVSSDGKASTMPRDWQSDRSTTIVWSASWASFWYFSRKQEASSEFITTSVLHSVQVAPAAPLEIEKAAAVAKATILAGRPKRFEIPYMEDLIRLSRLPLLASTGE